MEANAGQSLKSSARVEPEEFSRRVASKIGEAASAELRQGQVWLTAEPSRLPDILRTLRDDPELACEYFTFLSAVDWRDEGIEIITVVYSVENASTVKISVRLPADDLRMPTVTGVYRGAAWHERETHEMFGVSFEGHENLRNLYLSDDFEGNPLRKDFGLASRSYKPWPGAKDPDEAEAGGR